MITNEMGGVLPEQLNSAAFHRILDIGCGTGGWLIEAAKTYPEMELIGIDVSRPMIEYAREQAQAQKVADRIEFAIMDALLILEFPADFFDLVNMRLGISFLRTWEWQKLVSEMLRVSRPGGVIRVTECENGVWNSSPALMRIFEMSACAMYRSGHLFKDQADGFTAHLPELPCSIKQTLPKGRLFQRICGTYSTRVAPSSRSGVAWLRTMMRFASKP
jgi:ubiquinone/menaquinone biosynthesis C-methylase UbiE